MADQHLSHFASGRIVLGLKLNSAIQFLIGPVLLLNLEVSLGQLIVSLGKARIDLDRVGKLDRGFTIFPFLEVALAAVKVFLLTNVWIARASRKRSSDKGENQNKSETDRSPHGQPLSTYYRLTGQHSESIGHATRMHQERHIVRLTFRDLEAHLWLRLSV